MRWCNSAVPPEELPDPTQPPTIPSLSPPNRLPPTPTPPLPPPPVPPVVPGPPAPPPPGSACDHVPMQLPIGRGDPDQGPLPRSVNLILRDLGRTREFCRQLVG